MKRLLLSVLMLMAATFIFSQANKKQEEPDLKKEIVLNEQSNLQIN